ncbi:MAG: glycosyltransferase family 2 protein [Bacteroidota bacterium]
MKKVSIILVNWNGRSFILNCIKSIIGSPPSIPYEIIVVDNNSSDGSVEWMRSEAFISELPKDINFRVIANNENLGYGKANNIGFKNSDADFLFVLNPDTTVQKGTIDKLLDVFDKDSDIYMTAPAILNEDLSRTTSVWSGYTNSLWLLFVHAFKLQRLLPIRNYNNFFFKGADSTVTCSVDVVSGAAMMVKRETISIIGGFDEDFFMYGEDLEWCIRIKKAGKKIFFVPESSVIHAGGKSTEKKWDDFTRQRKMLDGGILVARKTMKKFMFRVYMLTYGISHFFFYLIKAALFRKRNPSFYFRKYFAALIK